MPFEITNEIHPVGVSLCRDDAEIFYSSFPFFFLEEKKRMENETERNMIRWKGRNLSFFFFSKLVNDDLSYLLPYIYIYDVIHLLSETLYNYLQIDPQEEERKKEKRTETRIFRLDTSVIHVCVCVCVYIACSNIVHCYDIKIIWYDIKSEEESSKQADSLWPTQFMILHIDAYGWSFG